MWHADPCYATNNSVDRRIVAGVACHGVSWPADFPILSDGRGPEKTIGRNLVVCPTCCESNAWGTCPVARVETMEYIDLEVLLVEVVVVVHSVAGKLSTLVVGLTYVVNFMRLVFNAHLKGGIGLSIR